MIKIPVYQPSLAGNEKKYVNECLDSTWISSRGEFITKFENKFREYTNVKYAASVSSGTAALHLVLAALGIGPGDEVIVPTLTYIAAVNAVSYTGAAPVFVDSLEDTWQINPADVRRKITPGTRAIMAVHLYGHPCDLDELAAIARERELFLIEDCAEAFGALYKGQHVGSFGHIAAYSFFGNKTITSGEGGMVVTNDRALYDRTVRLKSQGLASCREYWHDVIGFNYRMTNICAAIGLAQLEQADRFLAKKRRIAGWYNEGLKGLPVTVQQEVGAVRHSYWMCSLLVDDPEQRGPLREALAEVGVETRPLFYPVHIMPMYSRKYQRHPVAEKLSRCGINLPSWPGLEKSEVEYILARIANFYGKKYER